MYMHISNYSVSLQGSKELEENEARIYFFKIKFYCLII